ncbi:MAG: hypothetical protein ACYC8T_13245 [Myxococcaceae bacterium]
MVRLLVLMGLLSGAQGNAPAQQAANRANPAERLAAAGFTVVPQAPFTVIGDEPPARVRAHARGTVQWAATLLKKDFFDEDPAPVTVWLFKDAKSYQRNAKELFGDVPSTPYGYYTAEHEALVMNIATGGGTLVHEMVHPFVRANFPGCPSWLNEGLGSLFEQSAERDGHIRGLTNWRLAGLQAAIRAGEVPSFRALTATTPDQFYGDDQGTNYAQARYLLYYLQERGLLVRYFREARLRHQVDPTGYDTLKRVLGEKDMPAFQRRWEAFVLGLEFEG